MPPHLIVLYVLYQNLGHSKFDKLFFGAGAGRSQYFLGGAGANNFCLEPKKKKKSEAGAGEKCLGSTTLLFRYLNLGQMISNIKKNNEGKLVIKFHKCQVLKNSDNDNVSSRTIFLLSKIATLY